MAQHNELGKVGEELAEVYLLKNGFTILYRNWRFSRYEIDIVALKDQLPHFIEVKTRSSWQYGTPEKSVNRKKVTDLLRAASAYLRQHPEYKDFRIDILSITTHPKMEPEYFFIEDVYI